MSEKSTIEWTGSTWTPIRARNLKTGKVGHHCEKVSSGCRGCYAERQNRWIGTGLHYTPTDRGNVELFLDEKILTAPLRWKAPRKVFVCSMTDLFADFVRDEWIDRVFAVMALADHHTFQVLTKRPERMRSYMESRSHMAKFWQAAVPLGWTLGDFEGLKMVRFPLPNVWLGVSVEDQDTVEERVQLLLGTTAAVRFLSVEPLLEEVNLYLGRDSLDRWSAAPPIDWVIVGGESGPRARTMDVEWVRSVVRQCRAADVPCFVKQLGARPYDGYLTAKEIVEGGKGRPRPVDQPLTEEAARAILGGDALDVPLIRPVHLKDRKGGEMGEWPEDLRVREFPR